MLQRVSSASVTVEGETTGAIGPGIVALVAVGHHDTTQTTKAAARKIAGMRIFPDLDGKMNRSLSEAGGEVLLVSQFTLLGDASKGNRPSFVRSAPGGTARPLLQSLAGELRSMGLTVAEGRFGASMQVSLTNEGPVTLVLDV